MKKILVSSIISIVFLTMLSLSIFVDKTYAQVQTQIVFCNQNTTSWEYSAVYYDTSTAPATPIGPVPEYMTSTNFYSQCAGGEGTMFTWHIFNKVPTSTDYVDWNTACVDPRQNVSINSQNLNKYGEGNFYTTLIDTSCYNYDGTAKYAGCGTDSWSHWSYGWGSPKSDVQCPPNVSVGLEYCTIGGQTAWPASCTVGCGSGVNACTYYGCSGNSCVGTSNSSQCTTNPGCNGYCASDSDCADQYFCGTGSNSCNQYNAQCVNNQCVINPSSPHATNTSACGSSCGGPTPTTPPGGSWSGLSAAPSCNTTNPTVSQTTFSWNAYSGASSYQVLWGTSSPNGTPQTTSGTSLTFPSSSCTSGPGGCSFSYGITVYWEVQALNSSGTVISISPEQSYTTATCTACSTGQVNPHYACNGSSCQTINSCGTNTCTGPSDTTSCGSGPVCMINRNVLNKKT